MRQAHGRLPRWASSPAIAPTKDGSTLALVKVTSLVPHSAGLQTSNPTDGGRQQCPPARPFYQPAFRCRVVQGNHCTPRLRSGHKVVRGRPSADRGAGLTTIFHNGLSRAKALSEIQERRHDRGQLILAMPGGDDIGSNRSHRCTSEVTRTPARAVGESVDRRSRPTRGRRGLRHRVASALPAEL